MLIVKLGMFQDPKCLPHPLVARNWVIRKAGRREGREGRTGRKWGRIRKGMLPRNIGGEPIYCPVLLKLDQEENWLVHRLMSEEEQRGRRER